MPGVDWPIQREQMKDVRQSMKKMKKKGVIVLHRALAMLTLFTEYFLFIFGNTAETISLFQKTFIMCHKGGHLL